MLGLIFLRIEYNQAGIQNINGKTLILNVKISYLDKAYKKYRLNSAI